MIYVTGDIHGDSKRFLGAEYYFDSEDSDENIIVALGDFGANYYCGVKDYPFRHAANSINAKWYAVRGNHEARPQNMPGFYLAYDDVVGGDVWTDPEFPNLRYFKDFGIYNIGKYKCAVIGGAYSVDKFYRLKNGYAWYEDEQLSQEEMDECSRMLEGKDVDFVFSHTCPLQWEPRELFMPIVDQGSVDNSTEIWMDELKDKFKWKYWLFGHFHGDMAIRPHVEMLFAGIQKLDDIAERWDKFDETGVIEPWFYHKSLSFYQSDK